MVAGNVAKYLQAHGITVRQYQSGHKSVRRYPLVDFAVCVGGDGTALFACRALAEQSIPILTINYGKFGFITEVSLDDWKQAVENLLQGEFETESRILIDISILRGAGNDGEGGGRASGSGGTYRGLNDAVISVMGLSKIMNFAVFLNNQLLEEYRADGLIVATPTGSTAYSAAAGGPILHPTLRALVVNPICPFTLAHRPLVIPEDQRVLIKPSYGRNVRILLTIDGQEQIPLSPNDRIEVAVSEQVASIVRSENYSFFEAIQRKLGWSGAARSEGTRSGAGMGDDDGGEDDEGMVGDA